jgi:hypothetical protein
MYLDGATRSNISFDVTKLSRFTSNLRGDHWRALERVMNYLVGNIDYKILYSNYPTVLEGHTDDNWISDVDEKYATSGHVFTFGGVVVSWRSRKQHIDEVYYGRITCSTRHNCSGVR